jgi:ribosome-associated protein
MNPEEIALAVAELASDRKALDIVQLDLRGLTSVADYFVICTGRSDRQARAIYEGIQLGMKGTHGFPAARVDGATEGNWILMDYVDVIVHVFTQETRDFYRLEQLWGEAPSKTLEFEDAEPAEPAITAA